MERDGDLCSHQVLLTLSALIHNLSSVKSRWCMMSMERLVTLHSVDLAGKEQVSKAMKGEKAGGIYFPITAVQVHPSRLPFR